MNLCDRCRRSAATHDGLCPRCLQSVERNTRYKVTPGELCEEKLAHPATLARYDAMRQPRHAGGAR